MSHEMVLRITNAHNRIDIIHEQNAAFLRHLSENNTPEGLPSTISVEDSSITVHCYDHSITASHRVVRAGQELYAAEYIFYVPFGDEGVQELWRFYLTSNGQLVGQLDQNSPICDFDNRFVAKYICVPVMNAALDSLLFRPVDDLPG